MKITIKNLEGVTPINAQEATETKGGTFGLLYGLFAHKSYGGSSYGGGSSYDGGNSHGGGSSYGGKKCGH